MNENEKEIFNEIMTYLKDTYNVKSINKDGTMTLSLGKQNLGEIRLSNTLIYNINEVCKIITSEMS